MQPSALLLFRTLTSRIHHQLPLNPRESQQLLNVLTASFRRHLDREHPQSLLENAPNGKQPVLDSGDGIAKRGEGAPSHTSQHLTDRHLESLLTNPLFARTPAPRSLSSNRPETGTTNITGVQHFVTDPLDWFEERVAEGTANLSSARLCLEALQNTTSSSSIDRRTGGRLAGWMILSWLRSSGQARSEEFFADSRLARLLSLRLVSEGKQELVWKWLENSTTPTAQELGLQTVALDRWKAHILAALVQADLAREGSKDAAAVSVLRAARQSTDALPCRVICLATQPLLKQLAFYPPLDIAVDHYEGLISTVNRWTRRADIASAFLWLHHPYRPNVQPGLDYLKTRAQSPARMRGLTGMSRHLHLQLSLLVARQLLAETRYIDGAWMLKFARDKFPRELGLTPETPTCNSEDRTPKDDELANMRLLDRLSLG